MCLHCAQLLFVLQLIERPQLLQCQRYGKSPCDFPFLLQCESENRERFDLTLTFQLCDNLSDKR